MNSLVEFFCFFFFQAEDGIRDKLVTGVQTCALPIFLSWTLRESARRQGGAATSLTRPSARGRRRFPQSAGRWQWIPKQEQFQIAVAEVARRVDDDCKLFAGEIFVADPCGHHRRIPDHFRPLMESFSTVRRARLCRGSAQSRDAREVLETLCQCHIPGPPLDIGCLLVVAVFIGGGYE